MKFCKECGKSLKDTANFCPACGTPIGTKSNNLSPADNQVNQASETNDSQLNQANPDSSETINHANLASAPGPTSEQQPVIKTPRKPWTKKQKLSVLGIAMIAILLFIGYQIGAALTDKDRLIEKFGEAILAEDSEKIVDMLHTDDPRLEITKEKVDNLLKYINDNPTYYNSLMNALKTQANYFDSDTEDELLYQGDSNHIFTLVQNGKIAFLYDHYQINVLPFYFTVATNMVDAKIYLNDQVIATSDSEEFEKEHGPVFPGVYQLKATFSNEYAKLENGYEIELVNPYSQNMYAELPLNGEEITLDTDYDELAKKVTFYMNDKPIDMKEDEHFGPVSIDGSITAHAVLEFPWGKIESEKVVIEDNSIDLNVESPLTKEAKNAIMNAVHTFGQDWANAYNALDKSKFTNVTDSYLDTLAKNIADIKENNLKWVGTYERVLIDLDSFELDYSDGNYYANVDVSFYFNDALVDKDAKDFKKEESENDWQYELIYDNESGTWLLNNHYSLFWGTSHDNTKELVASE